MLLLTACKGLQVTRKSKGEIYAMLCLSVVLGES